MMLHNHKSTILCCILITLFIKYTRYWPDHRGHNNKTKKQFATGNSCKIGNNRDTHSKNLSCPAKIHCYVSCFSTITWHETYAIFWYAQPFVIWKNCIATAKYFWSQWQMKYVQGSHRNLRTKFHDFQWPIFALFYDQIRTIMVCVAAAKQCTTTTPVDSSNMDAAIATLVPHPKTWLSMTLRRTNSSWISRFLPDHGNPVCFYQGQYNSVFP